MADQRIQYTDEMVGNGHPTKTDTLNKHANVEHNTDGTHKMTSGAAGDVWYHDGTNLVRLAKGTAGQYLAQNAGLTAPEWRSFYDTIYIDAGAMVGCTTNGAAAGTNEYGTNDIDFDYFAFDGGATEERVQFKFKMPESWNLGTIKAKFDWSSATGSTSGDTVEWGLKAGALIDNDAIDAALGTPQVISDTLLANNGTDLQTTAATPAITIGGTPALGKLNIFEVYRNTDGTDDMAEDAWLFGVWIQILNTITIAAW